VAEEEAKPSARPKLALLAATLLPACYLWMEVGRDVPWRFDYPSLSRHDPTQLLFLYGEHARLAAATLPPDGAAKAWQHVAEAMTELEDELARIKRSAPRYGRQREERVLRDGGALTVMIAGWGSSDALTELEQTDVPEYAKSRARELREGETTGDRARATAVERDERHRRYAKLLVSWLAAPAALLLYLTRRVGKALPSGLVPVEPVWGLVLFLWCRAAKSLVHVVTSPDLPLLPIVHPFATVAAIPVVLWVLRGAWGRGPTSPLGSMLWFPKARDARLTMALAFAMALSAVFATTRAVLAAAEWVGHRRAWSEGMLETLLLGTSWQAAGEVANLVLGAPFLEEILYRGLLFGGLFRPLGLRWAVPLSALVFAAVHGYGTASSIIVMVHGCIYALVYARTRSLWPGIFLHAFVNVAACLSDAALLI
jgi:membrane protease YdiL (CAAX protease family)